MSEPSLIDLVLAVAAVVAVVVPIGFVWGVILAPEHPVGLPRLAVTCVVGTIVITVLALVLTLASVLTPLATTVAIVGLTLGPLLAPAVRGQVRRAATLPTGWAAIVAIVGIAGIGLIIVAPSRVFADGWVQPGTTTWYYQHLSHAIASTGGFPASLPEWGTTRPFQADYAAFSAATAALMQLMPSDQLVRAEIIRLAVLFGAVLSALLMLRRWVSSWLAFLGAVVLIGTIRLDQRFAAFRPEAFALMVGFGALWLFDRAMVERSPRTMLGAAVALAVVLLAHAEVLVVLLPAAAAIALVRTVWPLGGRRGIGRWALSRLPVLGVGAGVVGLAVFVGIAANTVIAGAPRLLDYATGGPPPQPVSIPPDALPPGWTLTQDPTWDFYVAAAQANQLGEPPPTSITDPRLLPRSTLFIWPSLNANTTIGAIVLVALLGLPLLGWPLLDGRRRRVVAVWYLFGLGLAVGVWLLYERSATYVPQRTGGRRLLPYELFVPAIAAVVAAWMADRHVLARLFSRLGDSRSFAVRGAIGLALAILVVWVPSPPRDEEPGLTPAGLEAMSWVRRNTEPGSTLLANSYTDGSIGFLSGGVGLLDGRAVYLEDPEFLNEATNLVLRARSYFAEPGDRSKATILNERGVDYLLVVGPGGTSASVGGYDVFPTDLAAIEADERLVLLRTFGNDELRLYRVDSAGTGQGIGGSRSVRYGASASAYVMAM